MHERFQILNARKNDELQKTNSLMNDSNEIYGACRHNPNFHRYSLRQTSSTDEEHQSSEKSDETLIFGTQRMVTSFCVPCDAEKNI